MPPTSSFVSTLTAYDGHILDDCQGLTDFKNVGGNKCKNLTFFLTANWARELKIVSLNPQCAFFGVGYLHYFIFSPANISRAFPLEYSCLCDAFVLEDCYILTSQLRDPEASSTQYA